MKIIKIDGKSMKPNIDEGQYIMTRKIRNNQIQRGDIVLFNYQNKMMIKRVIGLPSEIIELRDNSLIINGNKEEETYLEQRKTKIACMWELLDNQVVLLGDNSLDSLDSIKFGPVNINQIMERVFIKLWPPRRVKS